MPLPRLPSIRNNPLRHQSGAIMIITLIALSLLMLSALALIRSTEMSLSMAGNLAFKRDLVNQGERAIAAAVTSFNTGVLKTELARESPKLPNNYSATTLDTDPQQKGIPKKLINNAAAPAFTGADITGSAMGITARYVIDRLCQKTGPFDVSSCVSLKNNSEKGGSASNFGKVGLDYLPVYRISVRVTGPRNTQAFLQTTITR